jgi:hypothetical protein
MKIIKPPKNPTVVGLNYRPNRHVARDVLENGKVVSTIERVFDIMPALGSGSNYESIVFPSEEEWFDLEMVGYDTEKEAIEGHKKLIEKWSKENE